MQQLGQPHGGHGLSRFEFQGATGVKTFDARVHQVLTSAAMPQHVALCLRNEFCQWWCDGRKTSLSPNTYHSGEVVVLTDPQD